MENNGKPNLPAQNTTKLSKNSNADDRLAEEISRIVNDHIMNTGEMISREKRIWLMETLIRDGFTIDMVPAAALNIKYGWPARRKSLTLESFRPSLDELRQLKEFNSFVLMIRGEAWRLGVEHGRDWERSETIKRERQDYIRRIHARGLIDDALEMMRDRARLDAMEKDLEERRTRFEKQKTEQPKEHHEENKTKVTGSFIEAAKAAIAKLRRVDDPEMR